MVRVTRVEVLSAVETSAPRVGDVKIDARLRQEGNAEVIVTEKCCVKCCKCALKDVCLELNNVGKSTLEGR
jgi:hypothetical protein